MSKKHLDAVVLLEKANFSIPWSKKQLYEEINNVNSKFLVAVNNFDKVLGYIGFKFVLDEGYITNVAVFNDYRHNGIAKKLLLNIIDFGIEKKLSFIFLEVRKSNMAAIHLYKKLNFLDIGERKNFYSFPKENAIIMTKYLK